MEVCEKRKAIEKFLLDIDCLKKLDKWSYKVNIFDVLKVAKNEIRHSNILAWILYPNGSHGLGDSVIREFVKELLIDNKKYFYDKKINTIDLLLIDYNNFYILREWYNIDLILISDVSKIIICIENKIDSDEHNNQLSRYEKIINENYEDYKKVFIYLTPDMRNASEESWISYGYAGIKRIIENRIKDNGIQANVRMILEDYIDTLRRYVVKDDELIKICEDIYRKHKVALDLIFENRPDIYSNISQSIIELCEKRDDIIFDKTYSSKTYVRFTTKEFDEIFKPILGVKSGWGCATPYCFEFQIKDSIRLAFVLTSVNQPEEVKKRCEKAFNIISPTKEMKNDWQWKVVKSWKVVNKKIDDISDDEIEDIKEDIEKSINKIILNEINKLYNKLRSEW